MLKNIDPLLNPDVLYALRVMGHGDKVAICDANYPVAPAAASTAHKRLLRIDATATEVARAVLSVFPLEDPAKAPVHYMDNNNDKRGIQVQGEVEEVIQQASYPDVRLESLERHAFYAAVRECFCVISCLELRPFGNFILTKGAILSS